MSAVRRATGSNVMRAICRVASITALAPSLLLSGCFLFFTTRKLPVPMAPAVVQTVTPDQLVARLNQRWAAFDSMTAKVEMLTSVLKTKEGVAKDYTRVVGQIVMRKPNELRVLVRAPVVGIELGDMASDGKNLTFYIPSKNIAYKGSATLTKISANEYENLRPEFFLDSLAVHGLDPDDFYSVTSDSETIEDTAKKHLYLVPEYILSVTRHMAGSHRDKPVRVVTFHREDLLPYEQDLYDDEGNLETHVTYQDYRDFGSGLYPSTITIKLPLEDKQIVMLVEKESEIDPTTLPADEFELTVPATVEIKNLD
jgi:outer membrane lipoprotein-sorting protein